MCFPLFYFILLSWDDPLLHIIVTAWEKKLYLEKGAYPQHWQSIDLIEMQ